MHQLPNLKGCDVHSTVLLSGVDTNTRAPVSYTHLGI